MVEYCLLINLAQCTGCNTCTYKCIQENRLHEIAKRDVFRTIAYIDYNGEGIIEHIICRHCKDAPCIKVCPTNARTRTEYGAVLFDFTKCNGCQACINACPYRANIWDNIRNIPEKCTLCAHRIVKGEIPACVESCPVEALAFGNYDDIVAMANELKTKLNLKAEGIGTNNVIILRR